MIDGSQYIKKNTEFENYECEGRGIYITKISLFSFKLEFHLQMSPLAYEPLKNVAIEQLLKLMNARLIWLNTFSCKVSQSSCYQELYSIHQLITLKYHL